MTDPKSQPKTKTTTDNQSLDGPEDNTRMRNDQLSKMHLSAEQPAKSKFSTHLGITIRWGAPPPSYLSVTSGGGAAGYGLAPPVVRVGSGSC